MKNQRFISIIQYTIISIQLLALSGCQPSTKILSKNEPTVHAVWESDPGKNHWKFVLLEDGTFSEVIRADSQHMILEVGGLEINGPNYLLRYIFGPCKWSYDEKTRLLKISIVIDDFYVKSPGAELRCTLIDEFEGPVSKDGKTWTPKWTNIMRYDPPAPDRVSDGGTLKFTKLE